jgi:hypothetical protein
MHPSLKRISWFSAISARLARHEQHCTDINMSSLLILAVKGGETAPHFEISNLFLSLKDRLHRQAVTSRNISHQLRQQESFPMALNRPLAQFLC